MKRLLSFIICVSLLVSIFPQVTLCASAVSSGTCGDNLTWTLDDEGCLTISGTGDMWDWSLSIVPTPWNSLKASIKNVFINNGVTRIGEFAFRGCENLVSVSISNSVTSIGVSAFDTCLRLSSVSIPDSVIRIADYAFYSCQSLADLNLGNGVTEISSFAFASCRNLTSVSIPDSVTVIGASAFKNCKKLTNVKIGNNVTSIGNGAFSGCENLVSVSIPNSVTNIGEFAFYYDCARLNDVYYDGDKNDWAKINIGANNEALSKATIHYKIAETETSLSSDGQTFTVKPSNVSNGKTVILALYDGNKFVGMQKAIYQGENLTFTTDKTYTNAKIMIWDDLTNLKLVSMVEEIKAPEDNGLLDGGSAEDDDSNFGEWGV